MTLIITLLTANSPGVLARVISTLRRLGLDFDSHHFNELPTGVELIIKCRGEIASTDTLTETLLTLNGVEGVVSIDVRDPTGQRPALDGDIVDQLLNVFPDIKPVLDAFAASLQPRHRASTLHTIGTLVGRTRCAKMTINQPLSVELALDVFVIPMLDGIAECTLEGDGLRVQRSIFSRPREKRQLSEAISVGMGIGGTAVERCDFLAGYIEGVLQHTTRSNALRVTETHCRHEGQPFCQFAASTETTSR